MLLELFIRLFSLRKQTVASVMSDFQQKIIELNRVAKNQRIKAGKLAVKAEKALMKQDKAHSEALHADQAAIALTNLTKQCNSISLSDLKKDIKND